MAELEIHYPDGLVGFRKLSNDQPLVIGNGSGCGVQLNDPSILPRHCLIRWTGRYYRVEAEPGARNVKARGVVIRWAKLRPNDELEVGRYRLVVRAASNELIHDSMDLELDLAALGEGGVVKLEDKGRPTQKKRPTTYYTPLYRSPLFLGLLCSVAVLSLIGLGLFLVVRRSGAQRQFDAAMVELNEGKYAHAIVRFEQFVDDYPKSEWTDQARVWREFANVRKFSESAEPAWSNTLAATKSMLDAVGDVPYFLERIGEAGDLLVRTAEGLANNARDAKDAKALGESIEALAVLDRSIPDEHKSAAKVEQVQALIVSARLAIQKDETLRETLGQMDAAIAAKSPLDVYRLHRDLYQRYRDLADDAGCRNRRLLARGLEKEAVVYERLEAQAVAQPDDFTRPVRAMVTRTATGEARALGRIAPVLVGDVLYGLEAGTGEVRWRRPVGFAPAFAPIELSGNPSRMLVHCTRDNSLALMDGNTGKLVWRCALGSMRLVWPSQPFFRQNQFQVTAELPGDPKPGVLLSIQTETGRFVGRFRFPQRLNGAPVGEAASGTTLVVGEQATAYLLSPAEGQCIGALAFDHEAGSINNAPLILGRLLFITERINPSRTRLRCLARVADDQPMKERQVIELPGQVWNESIARGGRLFVATDAGQFAIYDLGGDDDPQPLHLAAQAIQKADAATPAYLLPTSEREFWITSGSVHAYRVLGGDKSGLATSLGEQPLAGPLIQPPLLFAGVLIVASESATGAVHVSGMSSIGAGRRWTTVLGQPPQTIRPDPGNEKALLVGFSGQTVNVGVAELSAGIVTNENSSATKSATATDAAPQRPVRGWTDGVLIWTEGAEGRLIWHGKSARPKVTRLPAAPHTSPAPFGKGVLIPCRDGMLYWMDPRTSQELCDPFPGPFTDGRPTPIGPVAAMNAETVFVVAGRSVARLRLDKESFPRFTESARIELRGSPPTNIAAVGGRVVLTHETDLVTLRPDDLQVVDRRPIGSTVSTELAPIASGTLLVTDRNELWCVTGTDSGTGVQWRIPLSSRPVRPPVSDSDAIWIALADGAVARHALSDGKRLHAVHVGQAITDGPWLLGEHLVVQTTDGALLAVRKDETAAKTRNESESQRETTR